MINQKEQIIRFHYKREDRNYDVWALWLWEFPNGSGRQILFDGVDNFGATATVTLSNFSPNVLKNNIGFLIKSKDSWDNRDCSDRKIDFARLDCDENGILNLYLKDGDELLYRNENLEPVEIIKIAKFNTFSQLSFETTDVISGFKLYENGVEIASKELKIPTKEVSYKLLKNIDIEATYKLEVRFYKTGRIIINSPSFNKLYKTKEFSQKYNYDGELGAIYSKKSTTFKVWSPVSTKISVRIYKNGTPEFLDKKHGSDKVYKECEMIKDQNGVFSCTIKGNLSGFYYNYVVSNFAFENVCVIDPYAKSSGINGLRGMIVDFNKTNPNGFEDIEVHPYDFKHLTVYELHIQDLTSSKTWSNRKQDLKYAKTFKGAAIEGTTFTKDGISVKTGFDHIKELGVNAVQLLPIFDQANDEIHPSFNWGYNPLNYNILEGSYSSDPYDGYKRIIEFKELVQKYNEAGINIVMDVVYNHVYGAVGSNFDVLMPGYYFRYKEDGTLSNGSACGNETASEMPMMRKFIIDSVMFFAKEYKLGGFRFDLMGIHDIDTMNKLSEEIHNFNKNIVIYGEPWSGGDVAINVDKMCITSNSNKFEGYGAFNDRVRDSILKNWVPNSQSQISDEILHNIISGIVGSTNCDDLAFSDPNKVVNYLTCHDNRTISDTFREFGIEDEATLKKMNILANSMIFTSNGISFMLSGEEFLRNKQGCDNSYNSSYELNSLDYSLKIKHLDLFNSYKELIKFKQNVSSLALEKGENLKLDVVISNSRNIISYELEDTISNRIYKIIHSNGFYPRTLGSMDLMDYKLFFDSLDKDKKLSKYTKINPFETLIVYKEK